MKELRIFFTALMFFSRIPVPKKIKVTEELLNKSIRYFPLAGAIIGGIGAGIFILSSMILPLNIAILLSLIATVFVSGAIHEDGFADFCDGYGGGYTKERILAIMKDSNIGVYGTVGVVLMLALRFYALISIPSSFIPLVLITGHAFSRLIPVFLIATADYVRDDQTSKSKSVANRISTISLLVAIVCGLLPLILIPLNLIPIILFTSSAIFVLFRRYVIRKSGGYTGDVLGALQQIIEVSFYLLTIISINLKWISI